MSLDPIPVPASDDDYKGLYYLFCDLETTGLDHERSRIVEIGAVLCRDTYAEVSTFSAPVYQNPHTGWDDAALAMHKASGLYTESQAATDERTVCAEFCRWLANELGQNAYRRVVFSGYSPHFDVRFLDKQWPSVLALPYFSNRRRDVSTVREIMVEMGWEKLKGNAAHRALPDCRAAIDEMKHWQARIVPAHQWPPPWVKDV